MESVLEYFTQEKNKMTYVKIYSDKSKKKSFKIYIELTL